MTIEYNKFRTFFVSPVLVTLPAAEGTRVAQLPDWWRRLRARMASVQSQRSVYWDATKAVLVCNPDDLVVNILPDGRVRVDGRNYSDEALEGLFARRRPKAGGGAGYPLVLRADRSTAFEHVQKIMSMAVAHGALSRIQFSARKEDAR